MAYLPSLLTLVGVTLVGAMSPGPDFATTVYYSTRSRREGIFVALGITSALSVWIIGSMAGLAVVLAQVSWLIHIIRLLGALYLIYLGVRAILHAHHAAPSSSVAAITASRLAAWRVGFLSNIGNPKVLAFFSSIFVVLFPVHPPFWVEAASVALMLGVNIVWYSLVVCVFSLKPVTRLYQKGKRWIGYLTGALFVALGVRLALER
ncbi:threonine transporter [Ktedonobacter sp. SOSP1-85]|uniref:LysE family translocator n=1 Tax=Ktedonobacter sp. SOSP1-85 TaxID=2778367 RepID=UPI00191690C2|nr:LysE family translocator [Ktedonobacter sp. SOSP1-85]GHO76549.1 threonine transporter [Ktedonobacter sp. SOSP1-85]